MRTANTEHNIDCVRMEVPNNSRTCSKKFAGPTAQGVSDHVLRNTFKRYSFLRQAIGGLLIAIQDGGWGPWIEEMGSPRVSQSSPKAPPEKNPEMPTTFENIGFSWDIPQKVPRKINRKSMEIHSTFQKSSISHGTSLKNSHLGDASIFHEILYKIYFLFDSFKNFAADFLASCIDDSNRLIA